MSQNPFAAFGTAIEVAETRAAQEAAELATKHEADAEALKAKVAADAALRSAQEEERRLNDFVTGFVHAVVKVAQTRNWSPTAIQAAQRYCMALAARPEVTIPTIDPGMGKIINDRFAYGIALQGDDIPSDWLNGQRQEWFPELLAHKRHQASGHNRLVIRPGERPRVIHSSTTPANTVEPPPATTPKSQGKDGRPAQMRTGKPGHPKVTAAA